MTESLYWLSDEAWGALEPHLPRGEVGKPRVDDRMVISGILHVLRTGCRWRDVPSAYGRPATIYNRFHRWSRRHVWHRIFVKLAVAGPVPEELCIDGDCIRSRLFAPVSRWHRPGRSLEHRTEDWTPVFDKNDATTITYGIGVQTESPAAPKAVKSGPQAR